MNNILSYSEAEINYEEFYYYNGSLCHYDWDNTPLGIKCPYCNSLTKAKEYIYGIHLFECEKCGWWSVIRAVEEVKLKFSEFKKLYLVDDGIKNVSEFKKSKIYKGLLKKYPVNSLEVPIDELRNFLKKHPNNMAFTHPTAFEKLMTDCIKYTHEYCEVKHVGGTADGGVDIMLISLSEGKRLVQVKRREDITSTEGVKVVRELNGVLFRENIPNGMIITTARKFSTSALKEIDTTTLNREKYNMKLFTYSDIVELFDIVPDKPYKPWEEIVEIE